MVELTGAERLRELVGLPRAFHDTEVLKIELHRDERIATYTLLFTEYRNCERSFEIAICFADVQKYQLEGFNHQNVVSSLEFEDVWDDTEFSSELRPRIRVTLDTVFGAWSTFTCATVDITSVMASSRMAGNPAHGRSAN